MKLVKQSNYSISDSNKKEDYIRTADLDLKNIFVCLQGRIRFGSINTGSRGENIAGEYRLFTTTATGGTQISHTLGAIPVGFLTVNKDGAGDIWMSTASATSATFASSGTSVAYKVFLLK